MSATLSSKICLDGRIRHRVVSDVSSGSGAVDERLEGAFGDLFGERPGRVMGAGRGPTMRPGYVPAANREDRGQPELVEAEQAQERRNRSSQFGVGDGPLEPADPL